MTQAFTDAQTAFPFVIAQGRNIESQIYSRRYPTYEYAPIVPVVTEGNEWAIGTTFMTMDTTGRAKFVSGKGTDIPFVSHSHDQASHDFAQLALGWEWTMEEINQAALYNIPLSATLALAASDGIDRFLYNQAMAGTDEDGVSEKGWTGFVNSPLVQRFDAPVDIEAATPARAAAIVNDALDAVRTNSNEVETADTIALPPRVLRKWATQSQGTGDGTLNVLEYIRANNIYSSENSNAPLRIVSTRALNGAGEDGADRLVAYRYDREVLRFHLPMPKRVIAPRQASLQGFEQAVMARTGGTEIRLPGAMAYIDIPQPA